MTTSDDRVVSPPAAGSDTATPDERDRGLPSLAVFIGLVVAAAALGARSSSRRDTVDWYRTLRKPRFAPPPSVFGPVWTVLYGLIAVSGWRVWRGRSSAARTRALALWGLQLALNAGWTPLFFGRRAGRLALADVVLLDATIAAYLSAAGEVDSAAAIAVAPYLAWSSFATLLTGELVRRNPALRGEKPDAQAPPRRTSVRRPRSRSWPWPAASAGTPPSARPGRRPAHP